MLLNTGIPSIGQPAAVGLRGSHWGEEYRRRPTSVTSFASVVFGGMTLGPFGPYGRCNPFGPVTDPAGIMNSLSEKYGDRKSTRLNSSHSQISYAVFCLKKK